MNQYFVHYYENGTKKKASNFKSLEDAIEFQKRKDNKAGYACAYIEFKEIVPDDFEPFPDTRFYKEEFSAGNVVKFENELAIIDQPEAALFADNHIGYFDLYTLLFLSGDTKTRVNIDELEFFAVGESYLVNAWHRKYNLYDDTICLVDMIKNIGR